MSQNIAMRESLALHIFSRLEKFHVNDKLTDVKIKFDNVTFKSHRIILSICSEYFERLFCGDLDDGKSETISGLKESMEAATFKEVLNFIYKGKVTVTSVNVFKLLHATDYLGIINKELENSCFDFIKNSIRTDNLSNENIRKSYDLALTTGNISLLNSFSSPMNGLFVKFSRSDDFLELSLDSLVAMLNQCTSVPEDAILQAVIRWVNHKRDVRCRFISELSKSIQITNLSISLTKSFMENYIRTVGNQEIQEELIGTNKVINPYCLNVYIYNPFGVSGTKIYSVDENTHDCTLSSQINSACLRSVALKSRDIMFTFDYNKRLFYSCKSVDHMFKTELKKPEFDFECSLRFEFCSMEQNETLYLAHSFDNIRNIYSYSYQRDEWSFVEKIPRDKSCMTASSNILYFIGGGDSNSSTSDAPSGLAYDYRTPDWINLPQSSYHYKDAASCIVDNRIYVCNPCGKQCEFYDITAGRWSTIKPIDLGEKTVIQKLIPYSQKLWLFSGSTTNFRVHLYDLVENKWSNYSKLNRLVHCPIRPDGIVIDAILFRSVY